jgi:thiosulfate/3-mercaptopyruvate sulfurtransferase
MSRGSEAPLVSADWIADRLGDPGVRLIEVDVSPAAFEQGHIPGAAFWDAYADLRDTSYQPVERAELERVVSSSGIEGDSTVVFYGYGAALGYFLMKAHGHADVRMLAGPRDQWSDAGGAWRTEVQASEPSSYRLPDPSPALVATRGDVQAAIDDHGPALLDTRSELEFSGERFWPSGASEDVGRAGHLPGAINIPIDRFVSDGGAFRGEGEISAALEGAGIASDRRVIAYCTIGNRASQAWFALTHLLGFADVQVYYPSWVEWGRQADTAIEV